MSESIFYSQNRVPLSSGCYCLIRSKHVCASRDERAFDADGKEVWAEVPAGLNPRDHHWVTFRVEYWDSESDCEASKPPVLTTDVQFGHRLVGSRAELTPLLIHTLDSHYVGGHRGDTSVPRWHPSNAVEDVLGLLKHPHIAALEVTP
jgi:hypothetical protein